METIHTVHIARVLVLDKDGKLIQEMRLTPPHLSYVDEVGFEQLKKICDMPNSAPAYIESIYTAAPLAPGRVTYKNAAMRKHEKKNNITSYK